MKTTWISRNCWDGERHKLTHHTLNTHPGPFRHWLYCQHTYTCALINTAGDTHTGANVAWVFPWWLVMASTVKHISGDVHHLVLPSVTRECVYLRVLFVCIHHGLSLYSIVYTCTLCNRIWRWYYVCLFPWDEKQQKCVQPSVSVASTIPLAKAAHEQIWFIIQHFT